MNIKYVSGLEDTKCSNPDCRSEFKAALTDLRDNLYGEGPEGDKGVYGVLKRKVSYKVLTIILSMVLWSSSIFRRFGD